MAISTYKTYLYGAAKPSTGTATLTKMVDIKDFPDMIGDPNTIETTTLSDASQTYISGIKQQDTLTFTFNYTKAVWTALAAGELTEYVFELRFGGEGADGIFGFEGQYTLGLSGGDVDSVVEATINIVPSTEVALKSA